MYHTYFGLKERPFDLCTNPRFLYLSPAHSRARAYLDYAVYKGDGLVVITGEIGSGKSTLIHDIAEREHKHADVIAIMQPQSDVDGFLQAFLLHCKHPQVAGSRSELIDAVQAELAERLIWGKHTTLIVDEAQKLSRDTLESLRMLADRQVGVDKPLTVVLVGQPCLRERLAGADMEQFRQRVRLSYHLCGLNLHETGAYIAWRLQIAGAARGQRSLVEDEAVARIHRFTGGIPRLINVLTDLALTAACLDDATCVSVTQVNNAIEELGWVPYPARQRSSQLALPGVTFANRMRSAGNDAVANAGRLLAQGARKTRQHSAELRQRIAPATQRATAWLKARAADDYRRQFRVVIAAVRRGYEAARARLALQIAQLRVASPQRSQLLASGARGAALFLLGVVSASIVMRLGSSPEKTVPVAIASLDQDSISDTAQPPTDLNSISPPAALPESLSFDGRQLGTGEPHQEASDSSVDVALAMTPARSSVDTVAELRLPGRLDADWLLAQQPDTYVIQILAAKKREVVDRFLAGKASELEIAYYQRQRNGQTWYVLVSGLYPDYSGASEARAKLPEEVRKTQPWIRPLAHVQADIRATGSRVARL